MNWIDIPSLMLVTLFAALVGLGTFASLWRTYPQQKSFGLLALSSLLFLTGIIMMLMRKQVSVPVSIITGNLLLTYTYLVTLAALCRLQLRPTPRWPWALPLLLLAALSAVSFADRYLGLRAQLYSLTVVVLALLILRELYREPIRPRGLGELLLSTSAFITAAGNLARILLIQYEPQTDLMQQHPGTMVVYLTGVAYLFLQPLAFILIYQQQLHASLQFHADHDDLTGLLNRRAFIRHVGPFLQLADSKQHRATLALMDLDWFKRINDEFGHLAGDTVLQQLADLMRQELSPEAILGRFGGEEFAIFWPGIGAKEASLQLHHLRNTLTHRGIEWGDTQLQITFSSGLAERNEQRRDFDSLYLAADTELYRAKENGRNCFSLA